MPMTRLPSLSSLRAFEAAGRRGSIKDAAEELAVTPGAVSQHIKALEADLGVALFVRKPRAIHLSAAGRQLHPAISAAFLQMRQAVDDVRPKTAPTLRIHATNAVISKWLLPRLHRFTAPRRNLQVHIESGPSLGNAGTPVADVEIRYAGKAPPDMYAEVLHQELMLVVASPTLLERYALETPLDLHQAPILHDTSNLGGSTLTRWEYWARHAGYDSIINLDKAIRFERPPGGQTTDAAIAGIGVGLCGSLLVHGALTDGRLICPFGPAVPSGSTCFVCCRPGREKEEHIRDFLSWARQEAAVLSTLNAMSDASGVAAKQAV